MSGDLDLAPAQPADLPWLVGLIPEAFPSVGQPAELIVARQDGALAGAAAVSWQPNGFPVLIHVEPMYRRRGIGRALLASAIADARGETALLRAWDLAEAQSGAALFSAACDFAIARRFCYFETDANVFSARMTRLRTRAASRIPASARIMPLADASQAPVAAMLADAFAVLPHDAAQRLVPGSPGSYNPAMSLVAVDGETPVGAMLAHVEGQSVEVAVNMVIPSHQGSWANLLMLEHMARECRASGIMKFRFGCEPHIRDTMNLAVRSQAIGLPDRIAFALSL